MNSINTWIIDRDQFLKLNPPIKIERHEVNSDIEQVCHIHSHFLPEIEFLAQGTAYQVLNGNPIDCESGSIFYMSPQDVHLIHPSQNSVLYSICFSEKMIPHEILNSFEFSKSPYIANLSGESYQIVLSACDRIVSETSADMLYKNTMLKKLLSEILIEIIRNCNNNSNKVVSLHGKVNEAIIYIHSHYMNDISLDTVACAIGITPQHLSRIFRESAGLNFNNYIKMLRLNHAYKLLLTSTKSITDISFDCGYYSSSHFSKVFKEYFGVSPSSIQRNSQQ